MAVTVKIDPERRHAVQVPAAGEVDEVRALSGAHDERGLLLPNGLLRERVPHVPLVPALVAALEGRHFCCLSHARSRAFSVASNI
jgi:hypothetical protein